MKSKFRVKTSLIAVVGIVLVSSLIFPSVASASPLTVSNTAVGLGAAGDALTVVTDLVDAGPAAEKVLTGLVGAPADVVEGLAVTDSTAATLPSVADPALTSMNLKTGDSLSASVAGALLVGYEGAVATFDGKKDEGTFIVQATDDGSVQILNVVEKPTAFHEFSVSTVVPEGASWVVAAGGSLNLIGGSGAVIAVADVPWSVDANGTYLETSFTVNGGEITQHTDTSTAAFPVVSDPELWWVIGTSAVCALEIASLAVGAAKVIQAFAKADKVVKATRSVIAAYNSLGGSIEKVVAVLKKFVKNKASLTGAQTAALSNFIGGIGKTVFNIVGLGSCYALATAW